MGDTGSTHEKSLLERHVLGVLRDEGAEINPVQLEGWTIEKTTVTESGTEVNRVVFREDETGTELVFDENGNLLTNSLQAETLHNADRDPDVICRPDGSGGFVVTGDSQRHHKGADGWNAIRQAIGACPDGGSSSSLETTPSTRRTATSRSRRTS